MWYLCLKLEGLFGPRCGKMREMREQSPSFLAVSHENVHGPIPLVADVQYSPRVSLLRQ